MEYITEHNHKERLGFNSKEKSMIDHKQLIERLRELQDALGRPPEFDDADTLADEAADALEVLIARDKDLKAQINAGLAEPRGCPTPGACSAVAEVASLRATLQGIVDADWRKWEELAQPEEFVRWAKCRANYALTYVGSNVKVRGAP